MKMEWIRQRVFDCEVQDVWGMCHKRMIWRHRDDGVLFALSVTVGHPMFDTREHIVREFAKFACQRVMDVIPCSEREFDETFLMNLRNYKGEEVTVGPFYSYPSIDPERVRRWEEARWSQPVLQRIDASDLPQDSKRVLI